MGSGVHDLTKYIKIVFFHTPAKDSFLVFAKKAPKNFKKKYPFFPNKIYIAKTLQFNNPLRNFKKWIYSDF